MKPDTPAYPLVDVVIPVYNRTGVFLECLETVLNQDYPHIRIFIIEDGSRLLDSKRDYFDSKKNITFLSLEKNHGVSYCRNLGAASGRGKYLAFLDSDDQWEPSKVTQQVEFMETNLDFFWVHTDETWIRDGVLVSQKKEHRKQGGIFFDRLMDRCLISPSSVFFRRDFFLTQGLFLPHFRVAEDYELWLRLNFLHKIGFIDKPLTIKRAGNWDQLSRTPEIDRYRVLALHRIYRMYNRHPDFKKYEDMWKSIILKKTNILIKGAEKYGKTESARKYQSWSYLFSTF